MPPHTRLKILRACACLWVWDIYLRLLCFWHKEMNSKTNIKKKLREIEKTLKIGERGLFLYWLGFKRALEWILNEQTTTNSRNKK